MKAILVPAGNDPRIVEVDGYKDIQRYVGGNIDAAGWIFDDSPAVYVNDEGKLGGLQPNRAVYARPEDEGKMTWDGGTVRKGQCLDIIFGDFICIGFDPETGEDRDVSDEEIARVRDAFAGPASIHSGLVEAMRIKLGAARR